MADFETTPTSTGPSAETQPTSGQKEILPVNYPYAGIGYRFLAFLIDTVILSTFGAMFWSYFTASSGLSPEQLKAQSTVPELIQALMNFLYKPIFESSPWQGTVGKKIFNLKVTDMYGRRIGMGRAILRHFAWMLSALPLLLGYLMAFVTLRKQCLHDKIVRTVVVKTK